MQYPPETLLTLFSEAAQKAELTLEHSDAQTLAEEINHYGNKSHITLDGQYLYETYRKTKKAVEQGDKTVPFSASHINRIAQYLDVQSFSQYQKKLEEGQDQDSSSAANTTSRQGNTTMIGKNNNTIEGDMHGTIDNH